MKYSWADLTRFTTFSFRGIVIEFRMDFFPKAFIEAFFIRLVLGLFLITTVHINEGVMLKHFTSNLDFRFSGSFRRKEVQEESQNEQLQNCEIFNLVIRAT